MKKTILAVLVAITVLIIYVFNIFLTTGFFRDFRVKVYGVAENGDLNFVENIDCGTGVDNIEFDREGTLWIGGHPDLLHFSAYAAGKKEIAPSELITVDYRSPGDYDVRSIYTNDGSEMSGSSVAVPYGDYIYAGNVMDDHFLVLEWD